jgi:hypothetical protein
MFGHFRGRHFLLEVVRTAMSDDANTRVTQANYLAALASVLSAFAAVASILNLFGIVILPPQVVADRISIGVALAALVTLGLVVLFVAKAPRGALAVGTATAVAVYAAVHWGPLWGPALWTLVSSAHEAPFVSRPDTLQESTGARPVVVNQIPPAEEGPAAQLISDPDRNLIDRAYPTLEKNVLALSASYKVFRRQVDIPDPKKGNVTYYRVLVGPFSTAAEVNSFCSEYKAKYGKAVAASHDGDCIREVRKFAVLSPPPAPSDLPDSHASPPAPPIHADPPPAIIDIDRQAPTR